MEYLVKWKSKKINDTEHCIVVRDYGAKLLADLLEENGYEFTIREMPKLNKNYTIDYMDTLKPEMTEVEVEKFRTAWNRLKDMKKEEK